MHYTLKFARVEHGFIAQHWWRLSCLSVAHKATTTVSRKWWHCSDWLETARADLTNILGTMHKGNSAPHHHLLLQEFLLALFLQVLLDVLAEWHKTTLLTTALGMVATEREQLFARGATTAVPAPAFLGVDSKSFAHVSAARERAVGVATYAGMLEHLYVSLDFLASSLLRILWLGVTLASIIQVKAKLRHSMWMLELTEARNTQVKVLESKKDHNIINSI